MKKRNIDVCYAVAFDMDGLIFDTEKLAKKSFYFTAEKFNITVEDDYYKQDGVDFMPGFHELFELLKCHNIPVGLVTTSSYQAVNRNFYGWDYLDRFDTVITSDRGLLSKPAPDKYFAAAKDLQIESKNLLVLEDSNIGMQAAINAGTRAVMIPDLVEPIEHIRVQAEQIFNNLIEVAKWLQSRAV